MEAAIHRGKRKKKRKRKSGKEKKISLSRNSRNTRNFFSFESDPRKDERGSDGRAKRLEKGEKVVTFYRRQFFWKTSTGHMARVWRTTVVAKMVRFMVL